jgi:hypothetical protein
MAGSTASGAAVRELLRACPADTWGLAKLVCEPGVLPSVGRCPVVRCFEEQVQRVVAAVHLARLQRRDRLVVHLLVLLVVRRRLPRGRRRAAQGLIPPDRAAWRERLREVGCAVCAHNADGLWHRLALGAHALPAIAHLVVVDLVEVILVVLPPLPARGREEALLAFASAAHTRRVVRVVWRRLVCDSGAARTHTCLQVPGRTGPCAAGTECRLGRSWCAGPATIPSAVKHWPLDFESAGRLKLGDGVRLQSALLKRLNVDVAGRNV